MATIAEQLAKLNSLKTQLAANLTTKGVSATATEKFNTLVPKVLDISGGESPTTTVLYDATHRDKVSLLYNGTIYSVADFTALHADFCSAKNNYALNYGTTVFGWDYSCYTCCTLLAAPRLVFCDWYSLTPAQLRTFSPKHRQRAVILIYPCNGSIVRTTSPH